MVPELVAVGCDVPVPDDVVGGGGRTIGCDEVFGVPAGTDEIG